MLIEKEKLQYPFFCSNKVTYYNQYNSDHLGSSGNQLVDQEYTLQ